jgi:hypothetical protein
MRCTAMSDAGGTGNAFLGERGNVSAEFNALNRALAELQRIAASGTQYGTRVKAEQNYALAYDAMVREGLRPKLRAKYRV